VRNHANRKTVDKLFVLGAGASLAASKVSTRDGSSSTYQAPLDAHFAARIAGLDLTRPSWVKDARHEVVSKFRPTGDFADYRLEVAILRQLSLLELLKSLHPRRSRKQVESHEWLNLVSHLICVVLRRSRENSAGLYERLASEFFPTEAKLEEIDNRIITFNYDTLLDTHLLAHRAPAEVYFDSIQERRDRASSIQHDSPLLLKLHGSINWRCAEEDLRSIIEGPDGEEDFYRIKTVWVDNSGAPKPVDKTSPLIIPPLPSKPITSVQLFNWLWTRAYEYLHEARQLIIVGYSLPPADQMADSLFGSFWTSRLEDVVIVDPSTAALDRWRKVLGRAGLSGLRWTYYEAFVDFFDREISS
jgi:SIR2-like protein